MGVPVVVAPGVTDKLTTCEHKPVALDTVIFVQVIDVGGAISLKKICALNSPPG